MPPRSLLVTFDAFGTLFAPRFGIASQYTAVAREHNVHAIEAEVGESFEKAFRTTCKKYPNYGKKIGMNPEDWWTQVVNSTFEPLVGNGDVPKSLAPAMIDHFNSAAAYRLHPSIPNLIRFLRANRSFDHKVIGIISNSDPRVPWIIRSLGLGIKAYHTNAPPTSAAHGQDVSLKADDVPGPHGIVDFLTLSYDVGYEKPDPLVFEAAFDKAKCVSGTKFSNIQWLKVHVGDDRKKDVEAADHAGWKGIFWDDSPTADHELRAYLGSV